MSLQGRIVSDDAWTIHTQVEMAARGLYRGPIDGAAGPLLHDAFDALLKRALEDPLTHFAPPGTSPAAPAAASLDAPLDAPLALKVKGSALRLDDVDLPRIGARITVGEDELHAILDVECRGSGFDREGRVVQLFEPHRFWRELGPGLLRNRATAEGLAYPTWGERPYPRDSYPRFWKAFALAPEAACRSSSWGLGQIMGDNCEMAGWATAREMVEAFAEDEAAHLEAMVRFIQAAGLDDELRERNWRAFARGYNGPGYAKHNYHGRLAQRFAWWAARPDTIWEAGKHPTGLLGWHNPSLEGIAA